jgi:hypothetical protein
MCLFDARRVLKLTLRLACYVKVDPQQNAIMRLTPNGRVSFVKSVFVCIVHAQHEEMFTCFAQFVESRCQSLHFI